MPTEHIHRFTCGRCKTRVELPDGVGAQPRDQPEGWVRLTVAPAEPRRGEVPPFTYDDVLCEDCIGSVNLLLSDTLKVVRDRVDETRDAADIEREFVEIGAQMSRVNDPFDHQYRARLRMGYPPVDEEEEAWRRNFDLEERLKIPLENHGGYVEVVRHDGRTHATSYKDDGTYPNTLLDLPTQDAEALAYGLFGQVPPDPEPYELIHLAGKDMAPLCGFEIDPESPHNAPLVTTDGAAVTCKPCERRMDEIVERMRIPDLPEPATGVEETRHFVANAQSAEPICGASLTTSTETTTATGKVTCEDCAKLLGFDPFKIRPVKERPMTFDAFKEHPIKEHRLDEVLDAQEEMDRADAAADEEEFDEPIVLERPETIHLAVQSQNRGYVEAACGILVLEGEWKGRGWTDQLANVNCHECAQAVDALGGIGRIRTADMREVIWYAPRDQFTGKDFFLLEKHGLTIEASSDIVVTNSPQTVFDTQDSIGWLGPYAGVPEREDRLGGGPGYK